MSLLSFIGLKRQNYNRPRLTLPDILHRTVVTGLAALAVYGVFLGYMVHNETLAKGRRYFACPTSDLFYQTLSLQVVDEAREQALAEAAQSALKSRSS
ncbi:hypothetical protein F5J12DRAFT_720403 [Pisolithus orientalis]|uniref:uncharacterized protein n=1 Tax=Pisolithus orientalis TaxID=936130 RepID=UPI0022247DE0|nr:uncharacterized protein F5J12DRAFT_720403 [Pisolithus orientalis]KAI6007688.1 hypothetical protein F5J12DRAFT_720403 [Pisolithus orientalis]